MVHAAIEYRVDGAILGCNKSCKNSTSYLPYMAKRLREEAGIPCLLLDYDHSDPRVYNDEEMKRQIDVFMEVVARHKEEREQNLRL